MSILKTEIGEPAYFDPKSAWQRHGPFAMWLVGLLKPRVFVELGTHNGYSYFAMCQAVNELNLDAQCYAVDTWSGDEHSGLYGNEVYENVSRYNDRYASFSTLLRKRFSEALSDIEDGSVDLLHVDGRHFYEDVKEDFESWIPKLSNRAVVLFHDTEVRKRNFGVWKYWAEICSSRPSINFTHQNGLGVLFWGGEVTPGIQEFIDGMSEKFGEEVVNGLFRFAGESYVRGKEMADLKTKTEGLDRALSELTETSSIAEAELKSLQDRHDTLKLSYRSLAALAQEVEAKLEALPKQKVTEASLVEVPSLIKRVTGGLRGIPDQITAKFWSMVGEADNSISGQAMAPSTASAGRRSSAPKPAPGTSVKTEGALRRFGPSEYGGKGPKIQFDAKVDLDPAFDLSVAVHLHLYYVDMEEEFSRYLDNIPVPFDLFVSVPEGTENLEVLKSTFASKLSNTRRIELRTVQNIGRDIYPFVVVFGPSLLAYDLVLHIHSKKSPYPTVTGWRRYLLHNTLGNRSVVTQILNRFMADAKIGGIFPPYFHALGSQPKWGVNEHVTRRVLRSLGQDDDLGTCPNYPAGSFFWIRPAALRPLLESRLTERDFDEEAGQLDGTTSHAMERLIGFFPRALGYSVQLPYIDMDWRLPGWLTTNRIAEGLEVPELTRDRRDDIGDYQRAVAARNGKKGRIAMVTAILGPFDALLLPEVLEADVDYFCFSDSITDGYGVFRLFRPPYFDADSRRSARYIKTNVLKYVQGYDHVVWIDANVLLRTKLTDLVARIEVSGGEMGAIPHPVRQNCRQEAKVAKSSKLDSVHLIDQQMARYRNFPEVGYERLIESNVLVLNARSTAVRNAMRIWWNEINTYSLRDQLSINYALFTAGVDWRPLLTEGKSTRDSDEFWLFSHGLNRWWPGGHPYADWHEATIEDVRDIEAGAGLETQPNDMDVDIVICVHNALGDVKACLASIDEQLVPGTRVLLVDDASDQETASFLRDYSTRSGVKLIRHDLRLGYTKAANSGVVAGTGRNVLLLNSDTVVPHGTIRKLCVALDAYETLGIVGPLSNAASTQSVPSIRGTAAQTAINALPDGMTVADIDARFEQAWAGEVARVPLVHGFCFAVKRAVFDKIGLFDELNFPSGYGEENDFCFRAADAGYDLGILTSTFIFHAKSKSYASEERERLMKEGGAALAHKHTSARVSRSVATMVAHPHLVVARRLARGFFARDTDKPAELFLYPALSAPDRPTGSAYVRVILPYSHAAQHQVRVFSTVTDGQLPVRPDGGAIAVLQRNPPSQRLEELQAWQQQWRADGNSIIYDLDDDLLDMKGVVERTGSKSAREWAAGAEWLCRVADVVTVSTPQLKQVVAPLNKTVHVVPNALDTKMWRLDQPIPPRREGPIRIGYYGTPTHDRDLELVAPAICRLEAEFGSKIDVEIVGAFSGKTALFGKAVPPPPKNVYPEFVSWMLDHNRWDIALVPLVDDRFNASKSNLKFLESSALGAAIAVSDVPTYRDVAVDGVNSLVVGPDDEAWYQAVRKLIVDPALRARLAASARSEVQAKWTIDRQLAVYRQILAQAG